MCHYVSPHNSITSFTCTTPQTPRYDGLILPLYIAFGKLVLIPLIYIKCMHFRTRVEGVSILFTDRVFLLVRMHALHVLVQFSLLLPETEKAICDFHAHDHTVCSISAQNGIICNCKHPSGETDTLSYLLKLENCPFSSNEHFVDFYRGGCRK